MGLKNVLCCFGDIFIIVYGCNFKMLSKYYIGNKT